MPPPRTPQGVNSPTFHPAPFGHSLSVPELYRYHALNSPTHPVFTYSDVDTGISTAISYREAWRSIQAAAGIVSQHLYKSGTRSLRTPPPVIAVLAHSDTLSYMYLLIAIMSLGLVAFPMSPRNNAEATAHLLKETGARHIFVNTVGPANELVRDAAALLSKEGIELELLRMVKFDELTRESDVEDVDSEGVPKIGNDDVVVILHSSGTTAFPKPIKITKKGVINLSNIPCYGELDLAGKRVAAHTNPSFHAMGVATFIWPPSCGATFAVYNPKPTIPTPANFLKSWVADKCDIVFCVPVFIEAWAQDPANLPKLRALDSIVFSGASVNKAVGDMLANAGVAMHPFWGSTEVGPATMFIPRDAPPPGEWEYFKLSNHITFSMELQEHLDNVFEPIMLPTDICFPHALNTTHAGQPAFAVGDFLERHPSDPGRWRVYGRKDDQIMLATGENVNPLSIEGIVMQDKHITSALMFGRHCIHTGLLIEPAPGFSVAPGQLESFKDLIWPTIEKANAQAPAYARIKRDMILTTATAKPLEYTPKGTPRRAVALRLYAEEIDVLYKAEEVPSADQKFPDRA
ncbi:acetyl-CoA synthetase-like protein [Mycena sp. CBHHK59/15]|nr:acetyl-CoA synthetase-like protein [Mycena sp. CBHHK59/15]